MKRKDAYPVVFAENAFDAANPMLADVLRSAANAERPKVLLVADKNVVQYTDGLGTMIGRYVKTHGIDLAGSPVVLSGGEKLKSDDMQSAMSVVEAAVSAKIGVNDIMLVLGGGSILDVAGWAAAQVRGGLRLVRMPTTVAAMADAAHADYAALDVGGVKDALRVPSVPAAVVVDIGFAETTLDGVWRAGFSEIVRLAAVSDAALLKRLSLLAAQMTNRDRASVDEAVRAAVALRQRKGATTFGLWSALRLESMSGYKLPHGYAVAIGVAIDATYAQLRGHLTEAERDQICGLLDSFGATEGVVHSRHLVGQTESIMRGLDAWRLGSGSEAIELPAGLGKKTIEEIPDRDTMKQALNMLK
jgi:3-dehydroquinate synthase